MEENIKRFKHSAVMENVILGEYLVTTSRVQATRVQAKRSPNKHGWVVDNIEPNTPVLVVGKDTHSFLAEVPCESGIKRVRLLKDQWYNLRKLTKEEQKLFA